jgi:hypothetical protein
MRQPEAEKEGEIEDIAYFLDFEKKMKLKTLHTFYFLDLEMINALERYKKVKSGVQMFLTKSTNGPRRRWISRAFPPSSSPRTKNSFISRARRTSPLASSLHYILPSLTVNAYAISN